MLGDTTPEESEKSHYDCHTDAHNSSDHLCEETRWQRMAGMCLRQNSRRNSRRASSSGSSSSFSNGRTKGGMIIRMKRASGIYRFMTVGMLVVTMASMVSAYTSSFQNQKRMSRYFAQESMLPPLPRIDIDVDIGGDNSVTPTRESDHSGLSVLYTNDPKMVSRWLSDHIGTDGCTLGFDLESVPVTPWMKDKVSFVGPAVVQLATLDACLVVHLASPNGRPSSTCGPPLEAVLRDETIVKAGVSLDQDILELRQKWSRLEARSRLDLGGIGASGSQRLGLKQLTSSILGVDLPKTRRLTMSNWSQVPLTSAQLAYSARDAWAGAAIIAELAARDPDTFGTEALVDLLRSQRTIDDLYHRQRRRKEAKNQLSSLVAPYSFKEKARQPEKTSEMPTWKAKVVKNLKHVMKDNQLDRQNVFDVEPLGFSIVNKNRTAS